MKNLKHYQRAYDSRRRPNRSPDALLSDVLDKVATAHTILEPDFTPGKDAVAATLLELVYAFERLDSWFSHGGSKPRLWARKKLQHTSPVSPDEVEVVVSRRGLPCPLSGVEVTLTGESQEFACPCGAMFQVTGLRTLLIGVHLAQLSWWFRTYGDFIRP
jgi:hypothetical protein